MNNAFLFFIVLSLVLAGCAKKVEVKEIFITKEVFIPLPCTSTPPLKPIKTHNIIKDAMALSIYAKELELAYQICKE